MSRAKAKSTTQPAGKRRSISNLYSDFEKAHAVLQALPEPKPPKLDSKAFDRAINRCSDIADRIVTSPADTIDEMLIKIAIAGWCVGADYGKDIANLDRWKPSRIARGEHLDALVSLRGDL